MPLDLDRDAEITLLANVITLTPGTVTVNIDNDEFLVYALTRTAGEALPGEMEARIGRALEGDA